MPMTATPDYLAHDDIRVRAILALAQHSAEYPAMPDGGAEVAVVAMLPQVPADQAVNVFWLVAHDLADAVDLDARGAEAVVERLGAWAGTDYLTADEKASEMRDEARRAARLSSEMLVSTQDALVSR